MHRNYKLSVESQKGAINIKRGSVENQKGTIAVHGDSALLVLNGTSLNSDNALLALNWTKHNTLSDIPLAENQKGGTTIDFVKR